MFLFSSDINHLALISESHGTCRDANISQQGHYSNERPIHLVFFMSSDNLLYDNLFTVDILILIIYGYLSSLFLIYYIFPIVALLYYLNNLHM